MATDRIITKADIGADGYFTDTHLIVEGTLTVEAGVYLQVRGRIEAGEGIKAGLTITAKWLSVKLRIFAGICGWKIPAREEQVIDAEVRSGLVAHGVVVRSKETPA